MTQKRVKDVLKTVALYLPQFHRIPENDEWWGEGFTEWTAARNAKPLYEGHNQPREPLNDNYYNLLDKKTMEWQVDLAKKYSVGGFCFYHYWFADGKKMLEKPAENLLKWTDIDMPFFFEWANESWIRTWENLVKGNVWSSVHEQKDGKNDSGVLLKQVYGKKKQWKEHFEYLLPFFRDERYLRIDGKPVFSFYKPESIPEYCLEGMISCWRELAVQAGLKGLFLIGVHRTEKALDCFDAWREPAPRFDFVPIKYVQNSQMNHRKIVGISYDAVWKRVLKQREYGKKSYKSGFVDYDTTPRLGGGGSIIVGAAPDKFHFYFEKLVKKSIVEKNELIFVNAWNEWGEGMYLEPDKKNGYAYLEALNEVMCSKVSDIITGEDMEEEDFYPILTGKDQKIHKFENYYYILHKWLSLCQQKENLTGYFWEKGYKNIAIYGFGVLGKHLFTELKDTGIEVKYAIDKLAGSSYIEIFTPEDDLPTVDAIIVTATFDFGNVERILRNKVACPVVSLEEVVDVSYYREEQ